MMKRDKCAFLYGLICFFGVSSMAFGFQADPNPGPPHEWLQGFEGQWEMDISVWPQPNSPPMKYESKTEHQMILGNRYLHMTSTGQMGPMTIESLMMLGFDKRMDKFTLVGFDSMGTYSISASGTWVKKEQVVEWVGVDTHPKNQAENHFKFKLTKHSKDHYSLTLHFRLPNGEHHQMAEMNYRRKSESP